MMACRYKHLSGNTVKPVNNAQSTDRKYLTVIGRWPLYGRYPVVGSIIPFVIKGIGGGIGVISQIFSIFT